MAGMATRVASDGAQPLSGFCIAHVGDERPCAVERRGAQVIGVPAHHIARGIAHAAADAFDACIGGLARRRLGRHAREVIGSGRATLEMPPGALPLVEERAHVGHEVAHDRQIAQRPQLQGAIFCNAIDMRAAGPARHAVHRHGAGAAHAHTAGVAIGERRIDLALDVRDDVEYCLARVARHLKRLQPAVGAAAPDRNLQALSYSRVSTNSRWPSASAAVRRPLAVRNMHSRSLSPAWSMLSSRRVMPDTSTSM